MSAELQFEGMYGPQFAKDFVNDYLKLEIPKRLIKYRNHWGVSNEEMPDPEEYIDYEPMAMDKWPIVITVALSGRGFTRVGHMRYGDPEYSVNYSMRTYVWARTEGERATTVMRDRLIVVVRSALMDHPCLKRANPKREAIIDESTITEEYSELTLLKGDRFLGGAYVGYDLRIEEPIVREKIADFGEVQINYQQAGLNEELQ
jgi:hypothetical protein